MSTHRRSRTPAPVPRPTAGILAGRRLDTACAAAGCAGAVLASFGRMPWSATGCGLVVITGIAAARGAVDRKTEGRIAAAALLVMAAVYILLSGQIRAMAFWIDEVNIIGIRSIPFDMVRTVSNDHVLAFPMDYWLDWGWLRLISRLPVTWAEFTYRIPMMAYHALAVVLSALTVRRLTAWTGRWKDVAFWLAVLGLFVNPMFFGYGIEFKYFALTELGIALLVGVFASPAVLPALRMVPMVVFFSMVAPVYPLTAAVMTAVWAALNLNRLREPGRIAVLGTAVGVPLLCMLPQLAFNPIVINKDRGDMILKAFGRMSSLLIPSFSAVFPAVVLGIAGPRDGQGSRIRLGIGLTALAVTAVILGIQLKVGYFDFHPRHFLVPLFLAVEWILLSLTSVSLPAWRMPLAAAITAALIIPGADISMQMMAQGYPEVKGFGYTQLKTAVETAAATGTVLELPPVQNALSEPVLHLRQLGLYRDMYGPRLKWHIAGSVPEWCSRLGGGATGYDWGVRYWMKVDMCAGLK